MIGNGCWGGAPSYRLPGAERLLAKELVLVVRTLVVLMVLVLSPAAAAESPYEIDGVQDGVLTGAGALLLVLSDGLVKRAMRSET